MKCGARAVSPVSATWRVRRETLAAVGCRTAVTRIRRGGVPVAATAAPADAGASSRAAAAKRAGRRCGPDSSRRRGCHAAANADAGVVTAAASHNGVISR
ncbi:hypothetical protein GCM10010228_75080 [Streptomyces massasporeus]|nr:hypothetical protein GCM10010228_75080 [Streptomyces massasporeus]